MKTHATTHVITVVSVLALSALCINGVKADSTEVNNTLIYNNRAYAQDIGYGANPAPARKVENAEIIYVNNAYGPTIYSYPSSINHQVTAFNVEYIDTAYGPAIYSYPNNNPKHHLDLVDNAPVTDRNVVPAALTIRSGVDWVTETIAKP